MWSQVICCEFLQCNIQDCVFHIYNWPNNPDATFCFLRDYSLIVFITFLYVNVISKYSQSYHTRFRNRHKTITKLELKKTLQHLLIYEWQRLLAMCQSHRWEKQITCHISFLWILKTETGADWRAHWKKMGFPFRETYLRKQKDVKLCVCLETLLIFIMSIQDLTVFSSIRRIQQCHFITRPV